MCLTSPTDLETWLDRIQSAHPNQIELGLDRVKAVADQLQLRNFPVPVVMVGGTNGKGSCVATLESLLMASGQQVATYTSPHLLRFNERLRIQGEPVEDAVWIRAFHRIEKQASGLRLTFFEFITLAALWILKCHIDKRDLIVLEVGLGGRLDAVNIAEPDVAIITSIDLDHLNYLGLDREAIGREKAGIIRRFKPVICGDRNPPSSVLQRAQDLSSPVYQLGQDFDYVGKTFKSQFATVPLIRPHLSYQSTACALMALTVLKDHYESFSEVMNPEVLSKGLSQIALAGRFQVLKRSAGPIVILDVGHNPAAAAWVKAQLKKQPVEGRTLAVVGMLKDKDIKGTLAELNPCIDQWFLADLPEPRGASATVLAVALERLGLSQDGIKCCDTVASAYNQALLMAGKKERILVFGSFQTVSQVMSVV